MVVTAKDLRFKISMLFDALSKKEEIIITYRNKPRAKLIPFEGRQKNKDKSDKLFGIWKDRDDDVDRYVRGLRKGRDFD